MDHTRTGICRLPGSTLIRIRGMLGWQGLRSGNPGYLYTICSHEWVDPWNRVSLTRYYHLRYSNPYGSKPPLVNRQEDWTMCRLYSGNIVSSHVLSPSSAPSPFFVLPHPLFFKLILLSDTEIALS